ncbi:DUF1353 domain-containing protein [Caulobacter sp. FWC2]|uniref:DUF1353 domain-containing protein n=1 Tax=Caulobacter sp. FWC2 TaxID=69664 RepID=UPI000C147AF9|nr:DUF1353 domain-containing protein [Caulobacter sp. FWC2]PIB91303.1 hypothetical protein CSW62_06760 [Caulobacter sp. FWC2]
MEPVRLKKVGRTGGLFGEVFTRPLYRTLDPFEVDGVMVEPGYLTDLVSAPWWVRPFMPLRHLREPALKHDWRRRSRADLSLVAIDDLFAADMRAAGVAQPWRFLCRWAVGTNTNR